MSNFFTIIRKICDKNNIKFTLLSRDWVIMLEKENKHRFIVGYKFELNNHAVGEICDDKFALFDVLSSNNIPVVEHNILYSKTNLNYYAIGFNSYDKVKEYFKEKKKIVIKSNTGTCGSEVYKIDNVEEIDNVLDKLLSNNFSISYCPYYSIQSEYRIIVLDNNIKLMYKKIKPVVIGNGKNTIRELLSTFNEQYFKNKLDDSKYDRVLKMNEIYEYSWKFNLSRGATISFDIDNKTKVNLTNIVDKVLKTISLNFASIDIVEVDNNFLVLEINSGVMMDNLYNMIDNKKIVEDIYEEAILDMFKINL
ncbi:MAG: hypothetical protein IJ068_07090 [Bacilli bacterium]|nr:hypothetical protein [Bacilli bacterium]